MKCFLSLIILIIVMMILLPGCVSTHSQLRIDTLSQKITDIQSRIEEKIIEARAGTLTAGEALKFMTLTNTELRTTRDELRNIKENDDVSWPEIIGALIASQLGMTGVIRAWRGPACKTPT